MDEPLLHKHAVDIETLCTRKTGHGRRMEWPEVRSLLDLSTEMIDYVELDPSSLTLGVPVWRWNYKDKKIPYIVQQGGMVYCGNGHFDAPRPWPPIAVERILGNKGWAGVRFWAVDKTLESAENPLSLAIRVFLTVHGNCMMTSEEFEESAFILESCQCTHFCDLDKGELINPVARPIEEHPKYGDITETEARTLRREIESKQENQSERPKGIVLWSSQN